VKVGRSPISCPWLRELAAGYLRDYTAIRPGEGGGLWGYFYETDRSRAQAGFFAGFLTAQRSPFLLEPPECAVFAFARPVGSRLHRRLVCEPKSPFRRSFELLTKYTNRRPRFEFHETEWSALIRHQPLAAYPRQEWEKYARNFYMETLALLVRSGLPRQLLHPPPAGH
jgi:hypothetical protein